jgi:mannitol-1-phosphate 5-dehydrogenase
VGRQPVRKLGRHERFVGPAAELAERGIVPEALLGAIGAALRFDLPEDAQSVELKQLLGTASAAEVTTQLTSLEASHPLYAHVERVVDRVQRG